MEAAPESTIFLPPVTLFRVDLEDSGYVETLCLAVDENIGCIPPKEPDTVVILFYVLKTPGQNSRRASTAGQSGPITPTSEKENELLERAWS